MPVDWSVKRTIKGLQDEVRSAEKLACTCAKTLVPDNTKIHTMATASRCKEFIVLEVWLRVDLERVGYVYGTVGVRLRLSAKNVHISLQCSMKTTRGTKVAFEIATIPPFENGDN